MKTQLALTVMSILLSVSPCNALNQDALEVPLATQLAMDAAGQLGRNAIEHVYLLLCPEPHLEAAQVSVKKGTGFLLDIGVVVTNAHVVDSCKAQDIEGRDSKGNRLTFKSLVSDRNRDLAFLIPTEPQKGGLVLGKTSDIPLGTQITTWGHPLGYNGPVPLLTVGHLSGIVVRQSNNSTMKRLVLNIAVNGGNSGGPLLKATDNQVVGVIVAKHAPMDGNLLGIIESLNKNDKGIEGINLYTYSGPDGKPIMDKDGKITKMTEAQLVAKVLQYFRDMTQVVIGEAIPVEELRSFLKEQQLLKVASPQ